MNLPQCIHFPIAAQQVFTCTEAAREDAFTRLLQRQQPDIRRWTWGRGFDTTLDAQKMDLLSLERQASVKGIALLL